jgi:hypothetical protein
MGKPARKIAAFRMAAYIVMVVGVLLFALTPLFIRFFKLDTDIIGLLVFLVGFAVLIVGGLVKSIAGKAASQKPKSPPPSAS